LLNLPSALFSALVMALVGGMLGLFVDALLASLWSDFWQPGWAQHTCWLAFLALAIFGLATGKLQTNRWVERSTADDAADEPTGTPIKGFPAMVLGAFGGSILGIILGGALLMMWFSLSLSPWPMEGWFESLRWDSAEGQRHDDSRAGGIGMATNHPVAIAMFCIPIAMLGVTGAIAAGFGGVSVGSARRILQRRAAFASFGAKDGEAADAADLPQLARAPRQVPWRIWRQATDEPLLGIVFGIAFFVAGCVCLAVLGVIAWNDRSILGAASALGISLLLLSIGSAFFYLATRSARTTLRALRYGRLAHATILQCQEGFNPDEVNRSRRWLDFAVAFNELNACWNKPLPIDAKGVRRFMTAAGLFGLIVFGFLGLIGLLLSGAAVYIIVVEGRPSGWFMALFMTAWWTFIVSMARLLLRETRIARRTEKWTPQAIGVRPVVDCRARFALPDGSEVEFETKVDLASRLAKGLADPHDIAVYDPADPQRAILLSSFSPPLSVTRAGQWEQVRKTQDNQK
jgi:hypothetical protein